MATRREFLVGLAAFGVSARTVNTAGPRSAATRRAGSWTPESFEPSFSHFGTADANCGSLKIDQLTTDSTTTKIRSVPSDGTIRDTYFTNMIAPQVDVNFYNCRFAGVGTAGGSATLMHTYDGVSVGADRCTFDPTTPNGFTHGTYGHHATITRCVYLNCKDGFRMYPDSDGVLESVYQSNLIGPLQFTCPDPQQPAGDGSHNDCGQSEGGSSVTIQGNAFHGGIDDLTGNVDTCYGPSHQLQVGPSDGRNAQGLILESELAPVSDVHILGNWFYTHAIGVQILADTDGAVGNIGMHRNKFSRDPDIGLLSWPAASPDTSRTHYYPIRCVSGQLLNSVTMHRRASATGNAIAVYPSALSDNVWMDDDSQVPVRVDASS